MTHQNVCKYTTIQISILNALIQSTTIHSNTEKINILNIKRGQKARRENGLWWQMMNIDGGAAHHDAELSPGALM